ncbi:MAG TPA: hypothetical protein VLQ80_18285, partial [Candidatus Saccharimonadia bacterium]|nr:hypothetical protein [Candidatus Saccharimonadia bacterium]
MSPLIALLLWLEQPGRTKAEAPRRWHGQSVIRQVEVEYSDGRVTLEALRFVVVHASQLAQQQTQAYTAAQAKAAEAVMAHVTPGQARWVVCEAAAEAASAEYEGRGQGRRGRRDAPGLSGAEHDRGTCFSLEQESRGDRPRVAGEACTDGGISHADGAGLAGLQRDPATGPFVA